MNTSKLTTSHVHPLFHDAKGLSSRQNVRSEAEPPKPPFMSPFYPRGESSLVDATEKIASRMLIDTDRNAPNDLNSQLDGCYRMELESHNYVTPISGRLEHETPDGMIEDNKLWSQGCALRPPAFVDTPTTPSDKIIANPLQQPPLRLMNTNRLKQDQLLSPRSSFNRNMSKDLVDSLMKPKVEFLRQNAKDSHSTEVSSCCNLDYKFTIRPPRFFCSNDDDNNSRAVRDQIASEINDRVHQVLEKDLQESCNEILGDLVIFELVDISTDGHSWDKVICYLFEECFILVDLKGESLIGKIFFESHIVSITNFLTGVRLQLSNDAVPELQICSDTPLIVSRLEYYFEKLTKKQALMPVSLYQLTINGWRLVDNYPNRLPLDLVEHEGLVRNNLKVPEDFLVKLMPTPEVLPLHLILSVTLLNNSTMSDNEYRDSILGFLQDVRRNMRPFDRVSLIFVGVKLSSGHPGKRGSFIANIEPEWSGWDSVYSEVKIFPNVNRNGKPIFTNGFDEMMLTLEKCRDLYPFLNQQTNKITRLIMLSTNCYKTNDYKIPASIINSVEARFETLLKNDKNLSIDFYKIGDHSSPEVGFGRKACLEPSMISNDCLKIPFDGICQRFLTMDEFRQSFLNTMVNRYQKICLPNVCVDVLKIIGTRDIVEFNRVQFGGKCIDVSGNSNLKLVFNNLLPDNEKEILLGLKVNLAGIRMSNYDNDDKANKVPLLSFATSWLNDKDDYKVLSTEMHKETPTSRFGGLSHGNLTPPMSATELSMYPFHKNHFTLT